MKIRFIFILTLLVVNNVLAQTQGIKILKATKQKTYSGASPAIIHTYQILIKKSIPSDLKIENIVAIADGNPIEFSLSYYGGKNKNMNLENNLIKASNKSALKIQFSKTEKGATDRRGRPVENTSDTIDLSEGVKIIYTFEGKEYALELKNFEELAPIKGK